MRSSTRRSATPRSRRASRNTRWPSRCRPACRISWTCPPSRKACSIATGANPSTDPSQQTACSLAGGGIKGGVQWGETDEFGYKAVKDVVHVHDLHATMLHLLGVDHTKLIYRFQGRDYRLTDVFGKTVKGIIA